MPPTCTHHVLRDFRGGTVCIDCLAPVVGREGSSAWELALQQGTDHLPQIWGLDGGIAAGEGTTSGGWLFGEHGDYRSKGRLEEALLSGGLPHVLLDGDLQLDRAIAANLARIVELVDFLRALASSAPRQIDDPVYFTLLGNCAILLTNAIRTRGGDYDGVVKPSRRAETPFSGYKAALAAAWLEDASLGAASPGQKGSGPEYSNGLAGGIQLGQMAVAPSHSSSGRAQGEGRILSRLAVLSAIRMAKIRQQHQLPRDEQGNLTIVHPGTTPVTEAGLTLLRLCDVGAERPRAVIEGNGTITPAIDPLRVRDALDQMKRAHVRGCPNTEHEARLLLAGTRAAVIDQLFVVGMIPAPQTRRPSRRDPEGTPGDAA